MDREKALINLPRIFATGYHLTAVGIYFNQVRMAERLKYYKRDDVNELLKQWIEHLKKISNSFAASVLESNHFLKQIGLKEPKLPQMPSEYVDWVNESHKHMVDFLPADKLPRALYLYGFCIGELMSLLTIVACAMDFQNNYNISFQEFLVKSQNDLKIIQRKWGSIAKALGQIDEFSPFLKEFLKADGDLHLLFIKDVNVLSKEEQKKHPTKIRNHIDFLENTMRKLQEQLPQHDLQFVGQDSTKEDSKK